MSYSDQLRNLGSLSHAQTLAVLKDHDLLNTVWLQDGKIVETENFFDVYGSHEVYDVDDVLTWLGY